jgi:Zn-dependent metalloprotease
MKYSRTLVVALLALTAICTQVQAQIKFGARTKAAPSSIENLSPSAKNGLKRYPAVDPIVVGKNGTPFILKGRFERAAVSGKDATVSDLVKLLPQVAQIVSLTPANIEFVAQEVDQLGNHHFTFSINYHGRIVVGAMLSMHVDSDGYLFMVNGTIPDETKVIEKDAKLTLDDARVRVKSVHKSNSIKTKNERLIYFLPGENQPLYLAWEMPVDLPGDSGQYLHTTYIDAVSGNSILTSSKIWESKQRSVRDRNGGVGLNFDTSTIYWPTTVSRPEGASPVGISAVDSNYDKVGTTYDYYYSRFYNYDGPTNTGATINTIVNNIFFQSNTYYGYNAFYTRLNMGQGEQGVLYFGTGNTLSPNQSSNYGIALDIVAHEYTHWVNDTRPLMGELNTNSNNATGSLDESFSDIFGSMTERYYKGYTDSNVWLLGETTGSTIRSMASPASYGALDYYPNFSSSTEVHTGSGIASLAFKLLATGGMHPNQSGKPAVNVPAIGEAHAEQAFFYALRYLIPTNAGFESVKYYTASAAGTLYGQNEAIATDLAWDAVGVPYGAGNLRSVGLAARAFVGTGDDVLIVGVVLGGGSGSKPMIVRAVGPTLSNLGVPSPLSNPYLDMGSVGNNNDWCTNANWSTIQSVANTIGLYPFAVNSLDSALLPTLGAGGYTAVVTGVNGGTGTALAEIYDTDTSTSLRPIDIAARGEVRSGDPLIAGFVIAGNTGKKVLIRALGPTLGINGYLANPKVTIYNNGTAIYTNDNWGQNWNASTISTVESQVGATPALPSGSADGALLVDLPPGNYSAVVEGVNNTEGIALVEFYEVY